MHDTGKVLLGLGVFVTLAAFPVWYAAAGGESQPPQLVLPTDASACVESREFMRTSHMQLLNEWRDSVVRNGDRTYVASNGTKWEKSLSRTCMSCHTNRLQFCGECHGYLGVTPSCWECHVEPGGN